jgi:hypothetical protein
MRKLFTLLVVVLLTASVFAQAPEKMSYQAVIRNTGGTLVTSTQIGMEINIRQGSETGTVVYTETQTPTTNANGLVSVEIGGGAGFSTINWANDDYFIETKTAVVAPLTTYTITGVSQLLSVPYALNAKTADNGITGAQTTKLAGIADGAEVNIQADWNQATNTADDYIKNKPSIPTAADGSETKVTAGTNVTVTGSGTTASPYVVNATVSGSTLAIGQSYQGGKIFWLDATGQHGLIAATADQSTGIQWYNASYTTTNAVRDGIGAGMYNTERIIANQGVGSYPAQLCANYQGGGYGDWYLPSKYELNLLYLQKTAVGGFASAYYWSSSESSFTSAWVQALDDGFQGTTSKTDTHSVRAVRAF